MTNSGYQCLRIAVEQMIYWYKRVLAGSLIPAFSVITASVSVGLAAAHNVGGNHPYEECPGMLEEMANDYPRVEGITGGVMSMGMTDKSMYKTCGTKKSR